MHDIVRFPAAHLHDVRIRHSQRMGDGYIIVPQIMKAEPGEKKRPAPLDLLIGPMLWQKKPALPKHHIEALLFQQRRILSGMENSARAMKSKKYAAVKKQVEELEARLTW